MDNIHQFFKKNSILFMLYSNCTKNIIFFILSDFSIRAYFKEINRLEVKHQLNL